MHRVRRLQTVRICGDRLPPARSHGFGRHLTHCGFEGTRAVDVHASVAHLYFPEHQKTCWRFLSTICTLKNLEKRDEFVTLFFANLLYLYQPLYNNPPGGLYEKNIFYFIYIVFFSNRFFPECHSRGNRPCFFLKCLWRRHLVPRRPCRKSKVLKLFRQYVKQLSL